MIGDLSAYEKDNFDLKPKTKPKPGPSQGKDSSLSLTD